MKRYGISSWIVKNLPTDNAIEALAGSGFGGVELSADEAPLVKAWEKEPAGVRRRLEAAGMDVPSIHSPGPGRFLYVMDEPARRASIAANLKYLDWMNECGIEEIVIHPNGACDFSTAEKKATSKARSMESLRVLAERAGQMGIRMAVENLGPKSWPGSTMVELLEMTDGLGDHVGLCLDVGHSEMAHLDLVTELKTATSPGKLFSLHIHDVNAEGKDHFIPGEGRIDFDAFLSALDASGSHALRTLEISPPQTNAAERLRQAAAVRDEWEAR